MVSANVLYMIWEQIAFKERKGRFLLMPAAAGLGQPRAGRSLHKEGVP